MKNFNSLLLALFFAGSVAQAATYKCKINELFPRKLPAQLVLKTEGNIATLESSSLGACVSFKKMKGWSSDSEYVGITAAVNCDVGMINMLFDPLKNPTINLTLSGTEHTHYEIGRANYICSQEK